MNKRQVKIPLKVKLLEAGITQRTLADKIGIDEPNPSRMVNGSRQPSADEVRAIAKALKSPLRAIWPPEILANVRYQTRAVDKAVNA